VNKRVTIMVLCQQEMCPAGSTSPVSLPDEAGRPGAVALHLTDLQEQGKQDGRQGQTFLR
jgi:hypothetical protein